MKRKYTMPESVKPKIVLVAVTNDAKYSNRTCVQAEEDFRQDFSLPPSKPFTNYLLCLQSGNRSIISIHDNYKIWLPRDYENDSECKPSSFTGLERMVDFYLNSQAPGLSCRMVMPPLVITNPEGYGRVVEAFGIFGYQHKDVPKNTVPLLFA